LKDIRIPVRMGYIVRDTGTFKIASTAPKETLTAASEPLIIIERAMPTLEQLPDLKNEFDGCLHLAAKLR
jgi:hypothetical protein